MNYGLDFGTEKSNSTSVNLVNYFKSEKSKKCFVKNPSTLKVKTSILAWLKTSFYHHHTNNYSSITILQK